MTTPQDVPTIAPTEVGDLPLLDVREDDEWEAGHAPQAIHIPKDSVVSRIDELPEGRIAVVCRKGSRSAHVVGQLQAQGRDAVSVEGGMESWSAQGLPHSGTII